MTGFGVKPSRFHVRHVFGDTPQAWAASWQANKNGFGFLRFVRLPFGEMTGTVVSFISLSFKKGYRMSIKLGQCWIARLSKSEIAVRLDDYSPQGGWTARSLSHGRRVWIRQPDQLIRRCDENGLHLVADETEPNRRSTALPPEQCVQEPIPLKTEIAQPIAKPAPTQATTLLDACATVLRTSRSGMTTREIIEAVQEKGLWNPSGKTPWLTLHTAFSRDIQTNGSKSRFVKKDRGKFALR